MEDELLTRKEVANLLKVSEATVYRLGRRGELPVIRTGKRFTRIWKHDVLAFLDRHTQRQSTGNPEEEVKDEGSTIRTGKH